MLVRCREPGCSNAPGIRVVSRNSTPSLSEGRSFFVGLFRRISKSQRDKLFYTQGEMLLWQKYFMIRT